MLARIQGLVKLSIRHEQATEEQILAQRRQIEREIAEIERKTIRVRAMAEAEGRAHEAKENDRSFFVGELDWLFKEAENEYQRARNQELIRYKKNH